MKRFFKIPPQVLRILLLAAGIVSSYGMARHFLTPPSFGQYGFYRGAALSEATARPLVYAGKKSCAECHAEVAEKLAGFGHKTLSCEGCHGPGWAHEQELVDIPKPDASFCIRCHEASPSRPKTHKQVVLKDHYSGSCIECHLPHAPSEAP